MAFKRQQDEYDSSFEGSSFVPKRRRATNSGYLDPLLQPSTSRLTGGTLPSRALLNDLSCVSIGQALRYHQSSLTAYDKHKILINQYQLYHSSQGFHRDSSGDRRDMDVVRSHHRFLWTEEPQSWEQRIAKKYYDKLYKEYCICDLSRYRLNKVGMRWRTEKEVVSGKGQFSCGEKNCTGDAHLKSWEMNFAYVEQNNNKNALIKLRLCEPCSIKLNFSHKRKDVTKKKKLRKKRRADNEELEECTEKDGKDNTVDEETEQNNEDIREDAQDLWKVPLKIPDERTRENEIDEYLQDLLL